MTSRDKHYKPHIPSIYQKRDLLEAIVSGGQNGWIVRWQCVVDVLFMVFEHTDYKHLRSQQFDNTEVVMALASKIKMMLTDLNKLEKTPSAKDRLLKECAPAERGLFSAFIDTFKVD